MRYIINLLFVAVLASSGALFFSADVKAQADCEIFIRVETVPDSSTEFPFTATGAVTNEFILESFDKDEDILLSLNDTVTVTQGSVAGWVLRDISCSSLLMREGENEAELLPVFEFGVSFSFVDSGVALTCDEPEGLITCTFINSRTETIPTLSEWGAIALVLGFGAVGYFVIRRRQVSA